MYLFLPKYSKWYFEKCCVRLTKKEMVRIMS